MCGIAGFSLLPGTGLERTALARALVAGISERGRDATGWAWRVPGEPVGIVKLSAPAGRALEQLALPAEAQQAILHVREFTKGIPALVENNHPVRWGRVIGVHNGHLENDDELFARYGQERSTPRISVDTEAIMMLTDVLGDVGAALEEVRGSAAVAILDERRPDRLVLARRARRPVVIAQGKGVLLFASTRDAIEPIARAARLRLRFEELAEGELVEVVGDRIVERRRFRVDGYRGRKIPLYASNPDRSRLVRTALAALTTG